VVRVKLNDAVWGALLLALALAVLWNVQGFPRIPGQNIGPGAFPGLLAIILAGCAVFLIVRGLRKGAARGSLGQWLRSPGHVVNFLLTVGVLVFYIVAADTLGFIITAALILLALFLKLGVKPKLAFPVAIVTVFAIHLIFYKLLRVSLPWGVLPILY
jgi:putative tricarboxylic transport membrane protein